MTAISEDQLVALKAVLEKEYVPHLPPLLSPSSVTAKNDEKNIARALAGFAIAALCDVEPLAAARYVVDDGDDYGIRMQSIIMEPRRRCISFKLN
jgi:hypothetical protein